MTKPSFLAKPKKLSKLRCTARFCLAALVAVHDQSLLAEVISVFCAAAPISRRGTETCKCSLVRISSVSQLFRTAFVLSSVIELLVVRSILMIDFE
mmetsp:Transcript_2941/g.4500  ORF Transcript_2941/g.4500 Transcript_2941/m.4500 type:complete len:96 (-) Transcript_2941:206-493(-)